VVSLTVGLAVYVSFWQETVSNIFQIYPSSTSINVAKLLLCVTMLLTFPLPFFTCRELVVQFFWGGAAASSTPSGTQQQNTDGTTIDGIYGSGGSLTTPNCFDALPTSDGDLPGAANSHRGPAASTPINCLQEPLLSPQPGRGDEVFGDSPDARRLMNLRTSPFLLQRAESIMSAATDISIHSLQAAAAQLAQSMILPDSDDRQLIFPAHVALTGKLWFAITGIAIVSPSLGDVLNLVGCASGALIAFILPACFSFKLRGYTNLAAILLVVGLIVGLMGTTLCVRQLVLDMAESIG
jgi:amino acid permease